MKKFNVDMIKNPTVASLIALTVFMTGCAATGLPYGRYLSVRDPDISLVLREDSTFVYEKNVPYEDYEWSSGRLYILGGDVYMDSYCKEDKFDVSYSCKKGWGERIVVNVSYDTDDKRNYCFLPYINGEDSEGLFCGPFRFESEVPVQSLNFKVNKDVDFALNRFFRLVDTRTVHPEMSMGDTLDVSVKIVDSLFTCKVFNRAPLKIKRKRVVLDGMTFKRERPESKK